ncbi:unnamed protein product [Miscanthus lutarioriparius]|uniref:Serine-threonine/tyrosine-protein kinase catalytic domain-containing protein n=1 Tax=Miscanthus lutarioriparius TaxID=422564 RepID=A0A811NFQ2_9POAL|nr:unnamed protein product [Miscanthus lutarioriparius]
MAVKVFHASLDQKTEEAQFMAEVGTIGRTHHVNLVRLFGFGFDDALRTLMYEYMEHGALDAFLLGRGGENRWFPMLAWNKYDRGELAELIVAPPRRGTTRSAAAAAAVAVGDELERQQCKEMVERMCKVAFWCVQQLPEARPPMSAVTKMLEGEMDVAPPTNPFPHLMAPPVVANLWTTTMTSGGTGNNGILSP